MPAEARSEYVRPHHQVSVVEEPGRRVYSIDFYARLPREPGGCRSTLSAGGPARLCYLDLPGGCEAVVLLTPGRAEVISLRVAVDPDSDPFRGSAARALEECWLRAGEALGVEPPGGE
ncbi:MAG: hypothetical protein LRS49_00215 [Desulfurococcales archaeon]|nr:hypothetical protein [Desulfurococcales archaeon]